jgi:hypothetical protein
MVPSFLLGDTTVLWSPAFHSGYSSCYASLLYDSWYFPQLSPRGYNRTMIPSFPLRVQQLLCFPTIWQLIFSPAFTSGIQQNYDPQLSTPGTAAVMLPYYMKADIFPSFHLGDTTVLWSPAFYSGYSSCYASLEYDSWYGPQLSPRGYNSTMIPSFPLQE